MVESDLIVWETAQYDFYRKLGNFVQYFQMDVPKETNGIPRKYIDPTVIAQYLETALQTDDIPEQALVEATVDIEFVEGYPTIQGIPYWERLDGEAINFYKAFKQYRGMKEITGVRSVAKLANELKVSGKVLNALSKVYHWQTRCVAYDKYREELKAWEKENTIETLNSKHSSVANKLLENSMDYLDKHPEQLNPKIALQMVQLAVKTGRVSAGLPADKPVGDSSGTSGGTNIQINNTPSNEINVPQGDIEAKVEQKVKDTDYLQSILHILDKSGAFEEDKIVDTEYEEE